jgi:hypothetical protein
LASVVHPYRFDADSVPDPTFNFDAADPDPQVIHKLENHKFFLQIQIRQNDGDLTWSGSTTLALVREGNSWGGE